MLRMLALLLAFFITTQVCAQDEQDQLQLFRKAINEKERENYVLSFEVTYPRCKSLPVNERLIKEYLIRVRGKERYSIITWYFKDQADSKKMTSQYFSLSAFSIRYDTAPFHLEFYTEPRAIEHSHNVDYRKLGRLTYSLGSSNGIPLSEYDRFFTVPFVKKQIGLNEIEYSRTTGKGAGKIVFTLIFKDGNTAYPAVSKVAYPDGITIEQMVKCGPDKSFPTEIDHYTRHKGELIDHQRIRNIKIAPLPADFVFTPTLLKIPINAEAFQDRMRIVYWDGRKFVDRPVPGGP